jgi:hypothetical protein
MKITEPYSPTPRAKASAKPVSIAAQPRQDDARDRLPAVRRRAWRGLLDLLSISSSTGCTVRTTNGRPMKVSAMTMPSGV